jgi:hypothetical protein
MKRDYTNKTVYVRIKLKLFEFGYNEFVTDSPANESWVRRVLSADCFPEALKNDLDYWCNQWLQLTKDIKEQNKVIAEESRQHAHCAQQEAVYRSSPGLARLLAAEIELAPSRLQADWATRTILTYFCFLKYLF